MPAPPAMFAQATPPTPPAPPVPPPPPMNWYAAGKGSFLGVGVEEIDPDHARKLKIPEPYGVEVTSVTGDGPAAKAGLKQGDVVLEFNGQRVEGVEQFVRLVRETPPGRTVKLLINRDGNTQTVAATVGDRKAFPSHMDPKFAEDMAKMGEELKRQFGDGSKFQQDLQKEFGPDSKFRQEMEGQFGPDSQFQRDMQKLKEDMKNMHWDMHGPDMAEGPGGRSPRLGIETEPMGSQLAEYFGVKQGVLVRSVAEGSGAAKAGIKAGDVIVRIGNGEVGNPGQISKLLREADVGKPVPVTVVRNKREMTLNATLGAKPGVGH
jgi:C-terminal processing protease CtpA/Prc